MKFKYLCEKKKLSGGKWVTLKNGHKTYISDDGEIKTGELSGMNVKDKDAIKKKYKNMK